MSHDGLVTSAQESSSAGDAQPPSDTGALSDSAKTGFADYFGFDAAPSTSATAVEDTPAESPEAHNSIYAAGHLHTDVDLRDDLATEHHSDVDAIDADAADVSAADVGSMDWDSADVHAGDSVGPDAASSFDIDLRSALGFDAEPTESTAPGAGHLINTDFPWVTREASDLGAVDLEAVDPEAVNLKTATEVQVESSPTPTEVTHERAVNSRRPSWVALPGDTTAASHPDVAAVRPEPTEAGTIQCSGDSTGAGSGGPNDTNRDETRPDKAKRDETTPDQTTPSQAAQPVTTQPAASARGSANVSSLASNTQPGAGNNSSTTATLAPDNTADNAPTSARDSASPDGDVLAAEATSSGSEPASDEIAHHDFFTVPPQPVPTQHREASHPGFQSAVGHETDVDATTGSEPTATQSTPDSAGETPNAPERAGSIPTQRGDRTRMDALLDKAPLGDVAQPPDMDKITSDSAKNVSSANADNVSSAKSVPSVGEVGLWGLTQMHQWTLCGLILIPLLPQFFGTQSMAAYGLGMIVGAGSALCAAMAIRRGAYSYSWFTRLCVTFSLTVGLLCVAFAGQALLDWPRYVKYQECLENALTPVAKASCQTPR